MDYVFAGKVIETEELLGAVQETFKAKHIPGRLVEGNMNWTREDKRQFFLQTTEGILWGRIFSVPMGDGDRSELVREYGRVKGLFKEPVRPVIFFPSLKQIPMDDFSGFPANALFYEYYFRRTEEGQSLGMIEHSPANATRTLASEDKKPVQKEISVSSPAAAKGFFKYAWLTRDEISELLGIGIELAKAGIPEKSLTDTQKVA